MTKVVLMAIPLSLAAFYLIPLSRLKRFLLGVPTGVGLALLLSYLVPSGILVYLVSFAIMASIFAIFNLGLNVQWGYTGLFNIGIAGFFAIGAFTSALFTTAMPSETLRAYGHSQAFGLEMPFLVGVAAGACASGIVAWLIGFPTLRLREDYLAIATIGIAEIIRLIFQNESWLANGPQPLIVPQPLRCLAQEPSCGPSWLPALAPQDYDHLYFVIVVLFLALLYCAIERISRSPWGRVLRAIREEEAATATSGKNIFAFKMQALIVGACVMGIGGALYAHAMGSISYADFSPLYATFIIWVMLMLGGSGNNKGAVLGAFVIWGVWMGSAFVTDWLRPLLQAISPELPARSPYIRYLFIAILLELILLFRPQGLLGEEKHVSTL
jgi:branched-chain amino acid transport system permease protein